ncbi:putative membrane protein [Streptococcus pyogenes AA216]|nr:putative membrane protein [Streptococcus pyogenes AA216]
MTHLIAYLTNIQKLYSCVYTTLLTVSINLYPFNIINL